LQNDLLLVVYCKETGGHFSDMRWRSEEVRYRG
jgi:hypothetical protein